MRRSHKVLLIVLACVVALLAVCAALWAAFGFRTAGEPASDHKPAPSFAEIAETYEGIEYDAQSGMLYMRNEVLVVAREDASSTRVDELLAPLDATVDRTMADIGIYRLTFAGSMTYEELQAAIRALKSSDAVEDAYLNVVSVSEGDAAGEADDGSDLPSEEPALPDDPWSGEEWNTDVPRGLNWGMEAIDAPGAWGYLDKLASSVKLGLIDTVPDFDHEDLSPAFASSMLLLVDDETGEVSKTPLGSQDAELFDDHGTHVAGIMGASWGNELGVSGVSGYTSHLYHVEVCYGTLHDHVTPYATSFSYLLSLRELLDQGVQVINVSQNTSRLVGFAASRGNENAIRYLEEQARFTESGLARIIADREKAGESDFVICVAAGNSNATTYYPDENEPFGYREEPTPLERATPESGESGGSLALYNNFLNLMSLEGVADRVIVVGALGIDESASTLFETRYQYEAYSNVGSRVDIVAPGSSIYSCVVDEYDTKSGTSMAAPHVAGVAGLVFAANPDLTGAEVKRIVLASTEGRFYHGAYYSGMLNAEKAVRNALRTLGESVGTVTGSASGEGLDVCFVVDTTNSMEDDIDNVVEHMEAILAQLSDKAESYRVALVDYRDFSERTGNDGDYPARVQLKFTDSEEEITRAIERLDLGYGGDDEETVYSALMTALELDWREDATKAVIILGDAAALDPEPETGYTFDDVTRALIDGGVSIDYESSDERVLGDPAEHAVSVFGVSVGSNSDALDFFDEISASTGGSSVNIEDASQVSDAIIRTIEEIEVEEGATVAASFGAQTAGMRVDLYSEEDGAYLFSFEPDEQGAFTIEALPEGTYRWACEDAGLSGTLSTAAASSGALAAETTGSYWFSPALRAWHERAPLLIVCLVVLVALCIAAPFVIAKGARAARALRTSRRSKADAAPKASGSASAETALALEEHRTCAHCGAPLAPHARFCPRCGAKAEKEGDR